MMAYNLYNTLVHWFSPSDQTVVIACSGGIDSLLLAHVGYMFIGDRLRVVHAVSPAVPPEATERVIDQANRYGWPLQTIETGEFLDDNYLANPIDRCFYCKSHLYDALVDIAVVSGPDAIVVSGANIDDLGEYRPGLLAAAERGVRHPYVELGIAKADIRALARDLMLPYAELPASPCLASRLYTGTRVTPERLRFVHQAEQLVRKVSGCKVVRCRLDGNRMRIEMPLHDIKRLDSSLVEDIAGLARDELPELIDVKIDTLGYAPGRAFVQRATE